MAASAADPYLAKLSPIGRVPDFVRTGSAQYQRMHRDHRGDAVRYVILDCSGTTMDRYVDAPALVFVEVFKDFGVPISMAEARVPMGLRKDLHIAALLRDPAIRERWRRAHGRDPGPVDVESLFAVFVPKQLALLRGGPYATLLPGVAEAASALQARGVKIGITTGFTRSMLDILLAGGRAQGFVPDTSVAGDEVESPRPWPYMVIRNLERMGVGNIGNGMRLTVKIDDTVSGVGEGSPLCWSVAVSRWGNYVVDSAAQADAMAPEELRERERAAKSKLVAESAAHYVIDDIRDLPPVIADIDDRLANGETPWMSIF